LREFLEDSTDVGLEINADKTKNVITSRHSNSAENQNIRIANESFESVATFKYLVTTLTNKRPKGKRPLERPRRRWEDNIKLDLTEIGIDGANWIRLSQDRIQWRVL
jgi:hypothetical protein